MSRSVILLGHGSRAPGAEQGINQAALDLAASTGWQVQVAHMELATPSLQEVVKTLVAQGRTNLLVVPYFLHLGIHLREDIPQILQEIRSQHPDLSLELTPHLGYDPAIATILERRVRELCA
ncbi:MAG: hypothetical protein RL318_3145 [Fibrobacterota bacterium]